MLKECSIVGFIAFVFGPNYWAQGDTMLSEGVPPVATQRLYDLAFKKLGIVDLRTSIGEFQGIRLMCLNERATSYTFFLRKTREGFTFEWSELRPAGGHIRAPVAVKEDTGESILALGGKAEFMALPAATRPVAVGRPYYFVFETFEFNSYRMIYRDAVYSLPEERGLRSFLRLAKELIALSDRRDFEFILERS